MDIHKNTSRRIKTWKKVQYQAYGCVVPEITDDYKLMKTGIDFYWRMPAICSLLRLLTMLSLELFTLKRWRGEYEDRPVSVVVSGQHTVSECQSCQSMFSTQEEIQNCLQGAGAGFYHDGERYDNTCGNDDFWHVADEDCSRHGLDHRYTPDNCPTGCECCRDNGSCGECDESYVCARDSEYGPRYCISCQSMFSTQEEIQNCLQGAGAGFYHDGERYDNTCGNDDFWHVADEDCSRHGLDHRYTPDNCPTGCECCRDNGSCGECDESYVCIRGGNYFSKNDQSVANNDSTILVIIVIVFGVFFVVTLAYICRAKFNKSLVVTNDNYRQSYHQPTGGGFHPNAVADNHPAVAVPGDVSVDNADAMATLVTAQVVAIADDKAYTTKFCTNCGILLNVNEQQGNYCGNCGARITKDLERECE